MSSKNITGPIISIAQGIGLVVVLGHVPVTASWADPAEALTIPSRSITKTHSLYGHLPLSFEANQGQTDPQVRYITRGLGHTLLLMPSEAVLVLRKDEILGDGKSVRANQDTLSDNPPPGSKSVVRMKFNGADPSVKIVGRDRLPGTVNYFIGGNPSKWRTNIPTYEKVEYKNIYPGIDLVYYGNQGLLEYDLVVDPGADPNQIKLAFEGVNEIKLDENGDLVLVSTSAGSSPAPLRLKKPIVYQMGEAGTKHFLFGEYVLLPSETTQHISFSVASYDARKPLIIDPVLSWSTYLGASGFEMGHGIAVDSAGNAYVTGQTDTPESGFPGTANNPIQSVFAGGTKDAFVTKINAAGTAIIYSTYLGGSGTDQGFGIAVDSAGNAYVTGATSTSDSGFPGTADSSIQKTSGGSNDAFVAKLNVDGTALVYSTYLGGNGDDVAFGITVDTAGHAYVTGRTNTPASDFPGTVNSSIQNTFGGTFDGFVTKINSAGTALIYSTHLGGSGFDQGLGIAVDTSGSAYITGYTDSPGSEFPGTVNSPIQNTYGGGDYDGFVTKINAAGTALVYSTYLGASGYDTSLSIAVDAGGNAYVTGQTDTPGSGFPGTANSSIQSTYGGGLYDSFVTKINPAGSALVYSTYLGGDGIEVGWGIAVDAAENAYVTGFTSSSGSGFPGSANSPIQSTFAGGAGDAFISKLNAPGTALDYSTYLGGNGFDVGWKIAADAAGNAYVTGFTDTPGSGFPGTVDSPIQNTFGGGSADAFVTKISASVNSSSTRGQLVWLAVGVALVAAAFLVFFRIKWKK